MIQNMSEHQEKGLRFVQQVYDTDSQLHMSAGNRNMSSVTFRGFVTSATIIERSDWKIRLPIDWDNLDEEGARAFIRTIPQKDRRLNMEKNRFRILVVQSPNRRDLYNQQAIMNTAKDSHWIEEEYRYFVTKGTAGSAVIETDRSVGFIMQTPKDEMSFFSLATTQLIMSKQKGDMDWTCLLFADHDLDIESLICNIPFPSDFASPLAPDFLFLSACLLQWQVEQTRDELNKLAKEILDQDARLEGSPAGLEKVRSNLFHMDKRHLMLHRRWLFDQDLAVNLKRCFEVIQHKASREQPAVYSQKLQRIVQTQKDLSCTLQHDLDTLPRKIQSQHKTIDSHISIMLAKNSDLSATAARRDSNFMKTIAIITLVFLPGTFIAAIFSMSMFSWDDNGAIAVSRDGWIYIVITIPLTFVVIVTWVIWSFLNERKYKKTMCDKLL